MPLNTEKLRAATVPVNALVHRHDATPQDAAAACSTQIGTDARCKGERPTCLSTIPREHVTLHLWRAVPTFVIPPLPQRNMRAQLDAAIAAHSMWKARLKTAIAGGELPDPSKARSDRECAFGKWLYATTPTDEHAETHARVRRLHAEFHRVAAGVLVDLQRGNVATAEASLSMGGPFAEASSALTQEMMAWKRSAPG